MKARIGGRTTYEGLSPSLRKVVDVVATQLAEEQWKAVQSTAEDRFIYALALALNDCLGYREKGISKIINAVGEILTGYGEDCYTPKEDRIGTTELERVTKAMKAELESRGIIFEWQ